jgi:hypothetical protein
MLNSYIVHIFAETAAVENSNRFAAISLPIVVTLGFVAATVLGSIAWYNSKRPVGWEDKERPSIVPEVHESEHPGLGNPNS